MKLLKKLEDAVKEAQGRIPEEPIKNEGER